jgi:acyl-CoA thioesterase
MEVFNKVVVFDNYEIINYSPGNVSLKVMVSKDSLNPYGKAHGGFLFTLCDSCAGAVGYSLNHLVVTQQSNINYMKGIDVNDEIMIEGSCLHEGKKSMVVQVTVKKENILCAQATFTMFIIE